MAATVVFRRLLFRDTTILGLDYISIHVPFRTFITRALAGGELPLWVPNLQFGLPFVGNGDAALFYPLQFPFFLYSPERGIGVVLWLHTALSMLTMYGFCRVSLRRSPFGAVTAGVIFGLNGFVLIRLGLMGLVYAQPWVPLLLLCLERSIEGSRRWLLAPAIPVAMSLLAGHPQQLVFSGPLVGLFLVVVVARSPSMARVGRACAATASAVIGGVGIAAIQVLPQLELVGNSARSDFSFADATFGSLPTELLWSLFLPDFWRRTYGENAGWIGVTAVVLIVLGVAELLRRRQFAELGCWVTVMASGLVLAVGGATPLYRIALAVYPGLDRFRFPARFLYPVVIAAGVLAAYGADAILDRVRGEGAGRRRLAAIVAASVAVLGAAALSPPGQSIRQAWEERRHLVAASLIAVLVAAGAAAAGRVGRIGRASAGCLLVGAITFELIAASSYMSWNHPSPAAFYRHRRPISTYLNEHHSGRIIAVPAEGEPERQYDALAGNTVLMTPASSVDGFGGQWPPSILAPVREKVLVPLMAGDPAAIARVELLRVFGVEYIVGNAAQHHLAASPDLRPVLEDRGLVLYRLLQPGTRVRAYCGATIESDGSAALERVLGDRFRAGELILEGNVQTKAGRECGSARVTHDAVNSVSVRVELPEDGWLLLSDTFYPGWQAAVDGRRQRVERAQAFFRAVRVPAGAHDVEFDYRPGSFRAGLVVSSVSAAIWLVAAAGIAGWRHRRSRLS